MTIKLGPLRQLFFDYLENLIEISIISKDKKIDWDGLKNGIPRIPSQRLR